MGYTPRQICVRAQESAWLLLSTLDREGLVAGFLDSYAREFNRPGYQDQPAHYREMLGAIRRESLLEMVSFLEDELPDRLGILTEKLAKAPPRRKTPAKKRTASNGLKASRPGSAERQKVELFRQEFFVSLGRILEWKDEEFGAFWRDHDIYRRLYAKQENKPGRRTQGVSVEGPFVDRCALLLDPSLMETARHAAAQFRAKLHEVTAEILTKTFLGPREN